MPRSTLFPSFGKASISASHGEYKFCRSLGSTSLLLLTAPFVKRYVSPTSFQVEIKVSGFKASKIFDFKAA